MQFEWDEKKNEANQVKHGLSFHSVNDFDWGSAVVRLDERKAYGEIRWSAMGMIDGRLYNVIFTLRGDKVRIISLRKANEREVRHYEKNTKA